MQFHTNYRRAGKIAANFGNSPLPARYQNKYGSMKPRPRLLHASVARGIIVEIIVIWLFVVHLNLINF